MSLQSTLVTVRSTTPHAAPHPEPHKALPGQAVHRPSVLLDCDPGHDDAAAISVAAAYTDVVAITTVSGNAPIEQTTHNALLIAAMYGLAVPIAKGAARPLAGDARHAPTIHGISGLDGPAHPPVTTAVVDVGTSQVSDRAVVERLFPPESKRREAFERRGSIVVGDVHPEVADVAGALSPVPGGVGPLTIAMLLRNTLAAAQARAGWAG